MENVWKLQMLFSLYPTEPKYGCWGMTLVVKILTRWLLSEYSGLSRKDQTTTTPSKYQGLVCRITVCGRVNPKSAKLTGELLQNFTGNHIHNIIVHIVYKFESENLFRRYHLDR